MSYPNDSDQVTEVSETEVMTVWPSICLYPSGHLLGKWFAILWPNIYFFRLGNLLALLTIPWTIILYFRRVTPWVAIRYTLTNRRVSVKRGLAAVEEYGIAFEDFDEIQIHRLDGQVWYDAGDLVFQQAGKEVFRLPSVSRPDAFVHVCRKTHSAVMSVREVRQQQAVLA